MENLSLFGYFVKCLKKYACFKGRARRKEFWGFMLFYYLFLFVLWFISDSMKSEQAWSILFLVYSLGTLIPMLAVAVRDCMIQIEVLGILCSFIYLSFIFTLYVCFARTVIFGRMTMVQILKREKNNYTALRNEVISF
jgi:uncharacterized membrane protein YhaH (DUF805 family)